MTKKAERNTLRQIQQKYLQEINYSNLPKWEEALFQGLVPGRIIFFLLPKPFSENSRTADSKKCPSVEPFPAEKMAVKDKKARFTPFVSPTHFQQHVGWGTRLRSAKWVIAHVAVTYIQTWSMFCRWFSICIYDNVCRCIILSKVAHLEKINLEKITTKKTCPEGQN